jgi:hypothetical protein
VLARALRAGPQGRRLHEAVAIVPSTVEPSLLEALAEGDLGHFDECLASGMLVEERGRVGFRHELARLAIEDAIPPARRVALHRAALRALMASPAGSTDPARLAHHAEQANDSGAVLALAPAAGTARRRPVRTGRRPGSTGGRCVSRNPYPSRCGRTCMNGTPTSIT